MPRLILRESRNLIIIIRFKNVISHSFPSQPWPNCPNLAPAIWLFPGLNWVAQQIPQKINSYIIQITSFTIRWSVIGCCFVTYRHCFIWRHAIRVAQFHVTLLQRVLFKLGSPILVPHSPLTSLPVKTRFASVSSELRARKKLLL